MLLNCGVGEDSWESLGLQGDPNSQPYRRWVLGVPWKDWFWSWNSNTLVTWWEELTHLKRLWCWESLKAGRRGDSSRWDGRMASPPQWVNFWSCCGQWSLVCCSLWGCKELDMTEWLNWTELIYIFFFCWLLGIGLFKCHCLHKIFHSRLAPISRNRYSKWGGVLCSTWKMKWNCWLYLPVLVKALTQRAMCISGTKYLFMFSSDKWSGPQSLFIVTQSLGLIFNAFQAWKTFW